MSVAGDVDQMKDTLRTWKYQKKYRWVDDEILAVPTDEPGNFAIPPEDVIFGKESPEIYNAVVKIVKDVYDE